MSIVPKKALSNLSNLVSNDRPIAGKPNLKRVYEESPPYGHKRKNVPRQNQENIGQQVIASKYDPTRTIENKIKKISISNDTEKEQIAKTKRVAVKAVKSKATTTTTVQPGKKWALPEDKWKNCYHPPANLPENVSDYDKSQLTNIESEPLYAYDIFQYYRQKEVTTRTEKYMHLQSELSEKMRAVLVDWMVDVQQAFELNHETLYLAVKFLDHYLMRSSITRPRFQLLGLTAVFIACKLDERVFPVIDDFIYLSDDAYTRNDFIYMEIKMLKVLEFNLNFPISYTFLRRYARCASLSIETLTLARYILESSLVDYTIIDELDSKVAAASLLLALKMKNMEWNDTLTFYSGYHPSDLTPLMEKLNCFIRQNRNPTIRRKYEDKVFFEVAKIKPLEQ